MERLGPVEVEPSIYAADFSRLGDQLGELVEAGAHVFQFDVGDGHFIPEITVGTDRGVVDLAARPRGGGMLDCHLMVERPERHFEAVAPAGGDSVTFHVEVGEDPRGRSRTPARSASASASRSSRRLPVEDAAAPPRAPISCSACPSTPGIQVSRSCQRRSERIRGVAQLFPDNVRLQVTAG